LVLSPQASTTEPAVEVAGGPDSSLVLKSDGTVWA
jgi:hypothetical protein